MKYFSIPSLNANLVFKTAAGHLKRFVPAELVRATAIIKVQSWHELMNSTESTLLPHTHTQPELTYLDNVTSLCKNPLWFLGVSLLTSRCYTMQPKNSGFFDKLDKRFNSLHSVISCYYIRNRRCKHQIFVR